MPLRVGYNTLRKHPPSRKANMANNDDWTAALLTGTTPGEVPADLWDENSTPAVFTVPLGVSLEQDTRDFVSLSVDQRGFAHGAIFGTAGSGKGTTLSTLISGLGLKYPPEVVEFVFVSSKDFPHQACGLPHTRAMFDVSDAGEAGGFVEFVRDLVSERESFAKEHGLELVTPVDLPAVFIFADEVSSVRGSGFGDVLSLVASRGGSLGVHLVLVGQDVSSEVFPLDVVKHVGWAAAFGEPGEGLNLARPAGGVEPGSGFLVSSAAVEHFRAC